MSGRIKAVFGKQLFIEGASVEKQNILYSYLRTVVKKYALKGHKRFNMPQFEQWCSSFYTLKLTRKNATLFGMVLYDNQYVLYVLFIQT